MVIRLRLPGGDHQPSSRGYVWRDFEEIFGELESIAYLTDRDQVFRFCRQFDVPPLYRDASLERLRHFRNRRIIIRDIRAGSWEFVLTIAAGAGFVLWQTLGKDAVDGYRSSRFSAQFKEFSTQAIDFLMMKVMDRIRSARVFDQAGIERWEHEIKIDVRSPPSEAGRLPTNDELLDLIDDKPD